MFFKMNFLTDLCALVICCLLCFDLTLGKPVESLSIEKLNQNLRTLKDSTYRGFLFLALGAASSGKTVFKTPIPLSEDCSKTSRVIMQSFEKPLTMWGAMFLLSTGVKEVIKHKNTRTFDDLVSMLCEEMSNQAKKNSYLHFQDIDERKKAVKIPRPAKSFILDVPTDQNFTIWVEKISMPLDDPEVSKLFILSIFLDWQLTRSFNASQEEASKVLKAFHEMYIVKSRNTATMDDVFATALNNYANDLVTRSISIQGKSDMEPYVIEFLKKVDQDFLKNEVLNESYTKIRGEVGLKN